MHRNTNGAGLVGDGTGDGLTNPPGSIGGKLVAPAILEFFHCFHQPHVAFLDQVEKRKAAVGVLLGDGDDEPQIGFHHFGFRAQRFAQPCFQFLIMLEIFFDGEPGHALQFFHLRQLPAAPLIGFEAVSFQRHQQGEMLICQMDEFFGHLLFVIKSWIKPLQRVDRTLKCFRPCLGRAGRCSAHLSVLRRGCFAEFPYLLAKTRQ